MLTNLISKLVKTITLSRVVMYSMVVLMSIILYTAYENRNRLFPHIAPPLASNMIGLSFTVGPETEEVIKERVLADKSIIGIGVFSADLRLNESRSVFFFGDDPLLIPLNAQLKDARSSIGNRIPLFTSIDQSNVEVIRLINGQFSCVKFEYTLLAKLYPEFAGTVKMVCRSSIPSYYGYFSGFVSVLLNEEYSLERQAQLKLVTDRLATDLYFRDVLPTQKQQKSESLPGGILKN